MTEQKGLVWESDMLGLKPRWIIEPDMKIIESLTRKHFGLGQDAACTVKFHAQGGFNKIYKVETEADCFIFRVALPVDPHNKTSSEVATINFIRENTEIPVAKIFAFDASDENELGFEWILMELLPGSQLRSRWRKLSMDTKRDLVKCVAKYQIDLFHHKFSGIGNLFENSKSGEFSYSKDRLSRPSAVKQATPPLGQIVSMIFFWGDHLVQDVPRGPFRESSDWLRARLLFNLGDQERILKTSDDEDDIEEAEEIKDIAERLMELLLDASWSSSVTIAGEPSILFHDDLNLSNILVSEDGQITGIIDWECTQIPKFLEGRDRDDEPQRDQYAPDDDSDDDNEQQGDKLDNEEVTSIFWEHRLEYEQTILRQVFIEESAALEPIWKAEWDKAARKMDIDLAIQMCGSGWGIKGVKRWLDALKRGEDSSLAKILCPPVEKL